jgi:hypothetical protein
MTPMRASAGLGLGLMLLSCGGRASAPAASASAAVGGGEHAGDAAQLVEDVEPGFVSGRAYDHAGVAKLQPLSTTEPRAIEWLKGLPVRRLEFDNGSYSLLWSYAVSVTPDARDSLSANARVERQSGVELLFDSSHRMLLVLGCAEERVRGVGPGALESALPDDLRPTSIGARSRLDGLRVSRVAWLVKPGGRQLGGRPYDHERALKLAPNITHESDARALLRGEPVARSEYDDGSYDLRWSNATERLSTQLTLRFDGGGVLKIVRCCKPPYVTRDGALLATGEPANDPHAPLRVRTIDLTQH